MHRASRSVGTASSQRAPPSRRLADIPTDPAEYRILLFDEIRKVIQDLNRTPPRQYAYQDWAYFLRLVGEDEGDSRTHGRARTKPPVPPGANVDESMTGTGDSAKSDGDGNAQKADTVTDGNLVSDKPDQPEEGGTAGGGDTRLPWSWVGYSSPLMQTVEEAEWILGRLTSRLAEELRPG